jgi:hypothetical protein
MIYAFISNLTGEFNIKHLAMDALEKVSVRTFPDKLNFILPEQVDLECYNNAYNTLVSNPAIKELRFCIGLQQLNHKPECIVEHCWISYKGKHFDSAKETENASYFLFKSLSLLEFANFTVFSNINYIPNIETLIQYRDAFN